MELVTLLRNSLRNLFRQRFYTFLNILGFGLGLTVFFLISIYVFEHYMTDRFHDQKDYLYRLETENFSVTGPLHGPQIIDNLPGVNQFSRIGIAGTNNDLIYNDQLFDLPDLIFADPEFIEFFPLKTLRGSLEHALKEPHSIIFTRTQAEAIFGTLDIIGKVVSLKGDVQVQVYAVVDDMKYTHLKVQAIAPLILLPEITSRAGILKTNRQFDFFTFLKLDPSADVGSIESSINKLFNELEGDIYSQLGIKFFLRPLTEIYFAEQGGSGISIRSGNLATVKAFMLVGLFVLLIAMINYMNLSTAKAFTRAREVGIRKLLGGSRWRLAGHFLVESVITTALAVFVAFLLVIAVLPQFNAFAGTSFVLQDIDWQAILMVIFGTLLIIGLSSGLYPAFYITAFQPVEVLKGHLTPGKKGASFRKVLIIFQFSISISLIAATLIVLGQINYMKSRELGFVPDDIIVFQLANSQQKEALRSEIMKHPDVMEVCFSGAVPGNLRSFNTFMIEGEKKSHISWNTDPGSLKLLQVHPVAGRHFDEGLRSEADNVLMINQAAINYFGLEGNDQEIIGQKLNDQRIVGIVPDFHFNSVSEKIAPLVIHWNEKRLRFVMVKTNGKNLSGVADHVGQVYNSFFPDKYFRSFFLDEAYDQNYKGVEKFSNILLWFSVFAIFISCLGLFGLASFMTSRRAREVAIRKIVGAGSLEIYLLLFSGFLKLLVISFLISVPVAWFVMDEWLKGFAYQQQVTPVPFVAGGVAAIIITILTISFHTIKITRINPAEVLRNE